LGGYWREILAASAAVIVARFGVVHLVAALLGRSAERLPPGWSTVLAWGGVRGALSIVLALGLPRDLPHRDQIVTMAVGVVLTSILLQGMSMAPLLRRLGLVTRGEAPGDYAQARAELRVSSLALGEVQALLASHAITAHDAERLAMPYHERMRQAQARMEALHASDSDLPRARRLQAVRHLLAFERDRASDDLRHEMMVPGTHERIARDIATRLLRLESGTFDDPADLLAATTPAATAAARSPAADPHR